MKKKVQNLSPVKEIGKTKVSDKLNNMKQISSMLLGKVFYTSEDNEKSDPITLVKFSESEDLKSQKLYKYTKKLSEYVNQHLSEMQPEISKIKKLNTIQLNAIKQKSEYQDYCNEVKIYKDIGDINKEYFQYIRSVLLKNNDLNYISRLLDEINSQWVDIVYGSGEVKDIKKLVCDSLNKKQLELASIGITGNKNATFQNGKFLNYILNYASKEERNEFSNINNDFGFLPKAKIDLVDIPSIEPITNEKLQIELENRKQEILQEVRVIIIKNEELMFAISEAITKEEEFEKRERALSQEYNKEKEYITSQYEQKLESKELELLKQKEDIENIRLEVEKKIELLEKTKNEEINRIKEEHLIETQKQDEKIRYLEIDREEYLKAKNDKIELEKAKVELEEALKMKQYTIDKYEEALKVKLEKINKDFVQSELNFDDEEDDENLIQEKGLLEDEFISNNDHNIMDNFNKGLVGENYISTNDFNSNQD